MKSMEFLPSTNFTLLNQIKGNSVMRFFFLKFVISVMGDQFLALGARKPSYVSGCVPFMYTLPQNTDG